MLHSSLSFPLIRFTSLSLLLSFSLSQLPPSPALIHLPTAAVLSVRDFGALGDGLHYDTVSIQSTIDACPSPSPCHVILPPGRYLTGTIRLRSGVVLVVQKGAVVLGGTRLEDYPKERRRWYAVMAEKVDRVGITGGGEINGQGLKFVERFDERKSVMVNWNTTGACFGIECRPRLVGFIRCKDVWVWNVKLVEPAYWCLHIVKCNNTTIHDTSIYGNFNSPNNDGIDIQESNNTFITRSLIDTADDGIVAKTYDSPVYNLTVTNCQIKTKSSAIKIGSESSRDFKHMMFDNITISESHRGLGIQLRDGGNIHEATFSNINITTRYYDPSWWGRAEPVYITTCPRHPYSKQGSISNVRFINITAFSENGAFLSGSKTYPIRNLKLINLNFSFSRWTNYTDGLVDYRPGCQGLVNRSMAGLIMEHVNGFEIDDVNMRWSKDGRDGWNNPFDFRPSTVSNISILSFRSGLFDEK